MEPKTLGLLVAILCFLVSLLINLIQHHYYRRRADHFLNKQESLFHSLVGLHGSLGKLETACALEMELSMSLKDMGKAIHVARAQLSSSIADIDANLRSFRVYRAREKERARHKRELDALRGRKSPK
jgi:type II secretory pathway component PulL